MLSITKLSASANACLGWPYDSPGTNDQNGIDCSGLYVKMYRDQGARIYHGSNTIYREYCSETGTLTSEKQLKAGMAVFKLKAWTDSDRNNKWYGKSPGNLSHIGYVDSVNPLRIIHASSVAGCVTIDTKIGKWACWGKLKDVDYGESPEPEPTPTPTPTPATKTMYVSSDNGKPVNMRKSPSLNAALIDRVPNGDAVTWVKEDGAWAYISWRGKHGWMLDCYLIDELTPTPDPEPEPEPTPTGERMMVWAENGKPVKLRAKPSTSCNIYDEIPCGEIVTVVSPGENWSRIDYKNRKGWYMMTKFLKGECL